MNKEYAKENLADMEERDEVDEWENLKNEIFSLEEILVTEIRTTKIINALSKVHARKKQILKVIKFETNNYFETSADKKDSVGDENVDSGRNPKSSDRVYA